VILNPVAKFTFVMDLRMMADRAASSTAQQEEEEEVEILA
jgi:hypothetical protein